MAEKYNFNAYRQSQRGKKKNPFEEALGNIGKTTSASINNIATENNSFKQEYKEKNVAAEESKAKTADPKNTLVFSNYVPGKYDLNREEYQWQRELDPTLPEFGTFDYFARREAKLRPIVEEMGAHTERYDETYMPLVREYGDFVDGKRTAWRGQGNPLYEPVVKSMYNKFKYEDDILDEYQNVNAYLDKFDKKGVHYTHQGDVDTKSGKAEASYAAERTFNVSDALANTKLIKGVHEPVSKEMQAASDKISHIADLGDVEKSKVGAYEYYEDNKDNKYNNDIVGVTTGNWRLGRIRTKTNDAGYAAFKAGVDDLEAAEVYQLLANRIQKNNEKTFTHDGGIKGWWSDLMQYAPQGIDQALNTAAGYALSAPLAFASPTTAKKAGNVLAAGLNAQYMYRQIAGAAFIKNLMDNGLSTEDAKKLAGNEAIASSIVEFALDWGVGKLFQGGSKVASKPISKMSSGLTNMLRKIGVSEKGIGIITTSAKTAGKMTFGAVGEGLEEGVQEGISITADRYAKDGEIPNAAKLFLNAFDLSKYSGEDWNRIGTAAKNGFTIGFSSNLGHVGGNYAINKVADVIRTRRAANAWTDLINDAKANNVITEADAKNAGVVRDDFTATLDEETVNKLDEFAKANGVRIEFADGVRSGSADASVNGRTIKIDKATARPYNFLLGHEMTHFMQKLSPEAYAKFEKLASKRISSDYIDSVYSRYTKAGVEGFTRQNAIEEAVADYAGGLVADSKSLDAFIVENRNDKGILGTVRSAVTYLKDRLTGKSKQQAEVAEAKLTNAINDVNLEKENTAQMDGERYYISPDLKTDLDLVLAGKVDASKTEILTGETDGFLVDTLKMQPLKNTMPVKKAYAAMVAEEVAKNNGYYYDENLHYHDLGPELLIESLKSAENPIAAFVSDNEIDPNTGKIIDRSDRIVLVTDQKKNGQNIVVVVEVSTPGRYKGKQLEVNKDITVYDRDSLMNDIQKAAIDNRLLHFDKKRSQTITAGRKGSQLPTTIQNVDFDANIARFWDNVNWKRSDKQTNFEGDTSNKTAFELAYEKALNAAGEKEQFSIKRDSSVDDAINTLREQYGDTPELQALIDKYGALPKGEKPFRDVELPERTAEDKYVSHGVRNALEAQATPDAMVPTIEELAAQGQFSHKRLTDKRAMANAKAKIARDGDWKKTYVQWASNAKKGFISKNTATLGWTLYNEAAQSGDAQMAIDILDTMIANSRDAAQALQAQRILKKLSPEGQMYAAQRAVNQINDDLAERRGKDVKQVSLNEDLVKQFMKAETQEQRDEILKEIYRDIGRQLPPTFMDKWRAWRYMAMLGNPRTIIRNTVGNLFFAPVVTTKNVVATGIEGAVEGVSKGLNKITGGKVNVLERSKGFGKGFGKLYGAGADDFAKVYDAVMGNTRYENGLNANTYIREGQNVFANKWLEATRKGVSKSLEVTDEWFSKPHYAFAFAQYCKANNITPKQISEGGAKIDAARVYAILEAQKATFRDINVLSHFLSKRIRETGDYARAAKVLNNLAEGVMPFKKTPANILARGVEYSPIGLSVNIPKGIWDVARGKITGAEFIDKLSAGLTGTGLLGLGVFLAAQGLVRGHGSMDDEEKEFEELMGHQAYSLELPNGISITLDWLAPEAIPFFMGVNLYETWSSKNNSGEEMKLGDYLNAIMNVTEPMLEMSCLQGLNNIFESVKYDQNAGIGTVVYAATESLLIQNFPTLFGQIERTFEDERMTTYTDRDSFLGKNIDRTLGKISQRIPIWDHQQIPYVDAWGRTEKTGNFVERAFNNFINPAYVSKVSESDTEKELQRLYNQTGEGSVLPNRAEKYFRVDGKNRNLSGDEYVGYAKDKGGKAFDILNDLVNSQGYKSASDAEKADMVGKVYDYSNQRAKNAVEPKYAVQAWVKNIDAAKKLNISESDFIYLNDVKLADKGSKEATISHFEKELTDSQRKIINTTKTEESGADLRRMALFNMKGLTPEQKAFIDKACIGEKKVPIDYTNENTFYGSQLSDSQKQHFSVVKKKFGIDEKTFFEIIGAYSGLKKDDIIAKLKKEWGLTQAQAEEFYSYGFSTQNKYYEALAPGYANKQKTIEKKMGISKADFYTIILACKGLGQNQIMSKLKSYGFTDKQAQYFYNVVFK